MRAYAIEYILSECGCQHHRCHGCNQIYYEYKDALTCAKMCAEGE